MAVSVLLGNVTYTAMPIIQIAVRREIHWWSFNIIRNYQSKPDRNPSQNAQVLCLHPTGNAFEPKNEQISSKKGQKMEKNPFLAINGRTDVATSFYF